MVVSRKYISAKCVPLLVPYHPAVVPNPHTPFVILPLRELENVVLGAGVLQPSDSDSERREDRVPHCLDGVSALELHAEKKKRESEAPKSTYESKARMLCDLRRPATC